MGFSTDLNIRKIARNDRPLFRRFIHRRLFGEPLAYLAGKTKFFGREFFVDRRVYIPNPETEQLVKFILKRMRPKQTMVDVGTGCGAIAITLKKEVPTIRVYAIDIDPSALEVARKNARKHGAGVIFKESLYVDDLKIKSPDIVVSDMPYGDERYTLPSVDIKEFRHMPPIATFHPRGTLKAYQELITSVQRKRWTSTLVFETGLIPKNTVADIIPRGVRWKYIKYKKYSITILHLSKK